ncbi:MAG: hypothetical protein ACFCU1_14535 [Sumerlaeia bacterium]
MREAKVNTTWAKQDPAYEDAVKSFVSAILADSAFTQMLEEFQQRIIPLAEASSLASTLLRMTSPGVPDIYQGCELWNLSLVDPDNRRPVDFSLTASLLEELNGIPVEAILQRMKEGLPKLYLMAKSLKLRRRRAQNFNAAEYVPLRVAGPEQDHIVAYLRGAEVAVVVRTGLPTQGDATKVELPEGDWQNCFTGEITSGGLQSLELLFEKFPVALLEKQS